MSNTLSKAIPGSIVELDLNLSLEEGPDSDVTSERKVDIRTWYIIDGELVKASDPRATGKSGLLPLNVEEFVAALLQKQGGKEYKESMEDDD
jgi:hypothetical protein